MTVNAGPPRLFVTGTDTGVGKTHVTCMIARQLMDLGIRVGAYKPVCSGANLCAPASSNADQSAVLRWDDVDRLKAAIGGQYSDDLICPQRFIAAVAPPIAAELEGKEVDFQQLVQGGSAFGEIDILLVEGAGGWLSPLTETKTVADLAGEFGAPVLIVARTGLGTINHTLLTIESVRATRLKVAGIILNEASAESNDSSSPTNGREIESRSGAPVLGTIPYGNETELHQAGTPVSINWLLLASS